MHLLEILMRLANKYGLDGSNWYMKIIKSY